MKKYYFQNGSKQEGPFTITELNEKNITRETLVWFEGQSDWLPAGGTNEINELFKSVPPPITEKSSPPPIQRAVQDADSLSKKKTASWGNVFLKAIVGTIVVVSAITIYQNFFSGNGSSETDYSMDSDEMKNPIPIPKEETYQERVMSTLQIEQSQPAKFLNASGTYRKNLLGDKIKIECKIANNATVATFKDATVQIKFYSKTSTLLGTEDIVVYEVFSPQRVKTVALKVRNYSDVNSLGWEVIKAKVN